MARSACCRCCHNHSSAESTNRVLKDYLLHIPAGKSPFGVAIADLNGDGKPDLAVVNYSGHADQPANDGVTILLGDGKGGFKIMVGSPFPTGHAPTPIAIGDVNGDG